MDPIANVLKSLTAGFGKPLEPQTKLPMRSRDEYRVRPQIARTWEKVAPELRQKLNALSAGELPWPLFLHGLEGRGKTRAVLCLCDAIEAAWYCTVETLKDSMLAHCPPWSISWGWCGGSPSLAVLDELGMHAARDFEFDAVKLFLDWREDRPAIYISNYPPDEMRKAYDRRIESRLVAGTVFELMGLDRRRQGK